MSESLVNRSTGACLIAAPLVWLASALVSPGERADSAAQLGVINAHPARWTAAAVLLILGTTVFVPGLAVLARAASRRTPVLGLAGTAMLGYGLVISLGDCFNQLVLGVVAGDDDRASMLVLLDRLEKSTASGFFFATGGLAFTIGSVLVAVAVTRSGTIPWWAGVLFGGAMVLNIVGWSSASQTIVAVSCLPMLAGLAVITRHMPSTPSISTARAVAA